MEHDLSSYGFLRASVRVRRQPQWSPKLRLIEQRAFARFGVEAGTDGQVGDLRTHRNYNGAFTLHEEVVMVRCLRGVISGTFRARPHSIAL